jgi:ubiquinone/menaquinone biosynthesis C-methylase UbiE
MRDLEGKAVLDLGCGTGALIPALAGITGINYLGVDSAPNMVQESQNLLNSLQLEDTFSVKTCDVREVPVEDGSFDRVVGMGLLEYFDDPIPVIREACRVCLPGGMIVFSIPRKGSLNDLIVISATVPRMLIRKIIGEKRDVPRTRFSPKEFRSMFDSFPVKFADHAFYNKLLLPYPFTRVAPRASRAAAQFVENRDRFHRLATGYIAAFHRIT